MKWEKYQGKGIEFLTKKTSNEIFTPEDFFEDHKMFQQMTLDFIAKHVECDSEMLDQQKDGLLKSMLKKAGELGLFGIDVPEEYGGLELDKTTGIIVTEAVAYGVSGAFMAGYGAHTGIGTLPIVFFGNEYQKRKYLPKLASCELISCYALTESDSGSDALSIKTKATLSNDGRFYILNGQKVFITNAGLADIAIVFAKIDGKDFTGFIVEMNQPGVSTGPEENKMGIKGSSTRSIIFDDVKVPIENILFEKGRGHVIAFNVLNAGRYKLGAGCLGSMKRILNESLNYSIQRSQFGKSIASFGAIKEKLANMMVRIFSFESLVYRTAGLIDSNVEQYDKKGADYQTNVVKTIEDFAVEASIMKVAGSEGISYVADEGVQIHGGYGYINGFLVERSYRDCRINRIFEGTNEINRLLIPGMIIKKNIKEQVELMRIFLQIVKELEGENPMPEKGQGLWNEYTWRVDLARHAVIYVSGNAIQKYTTEINEPQNQYVLLKLADMVIDLYKIDSSVLRGEKLCRNKRNEIIENIVALQLYESLTRIKNNGVEILYNIMPPDKMDKAINSMNLLLPEMIIPTFILKEKIADYIISKQKYILY